MTDGDGGDNAVPITETNLLVIDLSIFPRFYSNIRILNQLSGSPAVRKYSLFSTEFLRARMCGMPVCELECKCSLVSVGVGSCVRLCVHACVPCPLEPQTPHRPYSVLVSTSGDTGSSDRLALGPAAIGFLGEWYFECFHLKGRISLLNGCYNIF